MTKLDNISLKTVLLRIYLLVLLGISYTNANSQQYVDPYIELNYTPRLILENHSWEDIIDSVLLNYPHRERDLTAIKKSIIIHSSDSYRDTIEKVFLKILNQKIDWNIYVRERDYIISSGREALPVLTKYLDVNAATRSTYYDENYDLIYYDQLCDIAIKLIEEITEIYFFRNFSCSACKLSHLKKEDQRRLKNIVLDWYSETEGLSKAESIKKYLEYCQTEKCYGSLGYTAKNLGIAGDTIGSIQFLTQYYESSKTSNMINMLMATMALEFGGEIAKKDCIDYLSAYKGGGIYGRECIDYLLLKLPPSLENYESLADVINTHKKSLLSNNDNKSIWYSVFGYTVNIEDQAVKPILLRMLEVNVVPKNSLLLWQRKYPKAFEEGYRVCDLALLRLVDLFPNEISVKDWSDINERDQVINLLLEQHDFGE